MGQDLFTYLPSEITIDILSRLPVRTTLSCKCVRKSWRSLIETPEFVKSYKPVPSLAVFQGKTGLNPFKVYELEDEGKTSSNPYKVYELEDELNLENSKNSCNVLFNFSFPHPYLIHNSVDGLLFLFGPKVWGPEDIAICNPVTREYIKLHSPVPWQIWSDTFGFGVSKTTGQYKLVRIFQESRHLKLHESQCQVYTLGTGLWRCVASSGKLMHCYMRGAFLNGNIHWLASDFGSSSLWISCFDLESELFTTFSRPHPYDCDNKKVYETLSSLRDCLCLCDNSADAEIVIWLMNTYGDEKSWTKQFVIPKPRIDINCYFYHNFMFPIKALKDDDILIAEDGCYHILWYSNKTKAIQAIDQIESPNGFHASAVCYTPSFLPLKTFFPMENVSSF